MQDKNSVRTLILSNQRRFTLSSRHDEKKIKDYLFESQIIYKTIIDLPILPGRAAKLEDELIRRSIFGTAAIEGNPLTEKQVEELVEDSHEINPVQRAEQEILNLKKTYGLLDRMVSGAEGNLVSERDFIDLHRSITGGIDYDGNTPGKYRNHQVKVGDSVHGGIYTPPSIAADIILLMKEMVDWLNSKSILELDPIIRAALAHFHFSFIHPFGDGNGRVARTFEAYLLRLSKIKYVPVMLSSYYYKNIDEYYWTFSKTIKAKDHDITVFLEFVLKGFVESLHDIKGRITFFIRKFALKDAYSFLKEKKSINKRQFELLNILLNNDLAFTLKDLAVMTPFHLLYQGVSERTIKRDIQSLANLLLIKETSKKKYKINMNFLG